MIRRLGRWFSDWRNGATLAASALVVLLGFTVASAVRGRDEAFTSLQRTTTEQADARSAATRRIDMLTARIGELQSSAEANGGRISTLLAEVAALESQVRQLGGRPVVTLTPAASSTTTTTVRPAPRPGNAPNAPGPAAPPSTTSTTTPGSPPCQFPVPLVGCPVR